MLSKLNTLNALAVFSPISLFQCGKCNHTAVLGFFFDFCWFFVRVCGCERERVLSIYLNLLGAFNGVARYYDHLVRVSPVFIVVI